MSTHDDNLREHIFDLTNRDILSATGQELRYGIDYDLVVESFYCEFKLDVKELQSIQRQYIATDNPAERKRLHSEFTRLYPECTADDISIIPIPETVTKTAWFVQSPRGVDGLPTVHYSLKEKMLSDFRNMRSKVKKLQANAAEMGDHIAEARYNAQQLAIKVVCNSEYGASNNEHFAHYDPDIAAAVTRASRSLIAFLTENIQSSELYVDEAFINENRKELELLSGIGCLRYDRVETPEDCVVDLSKIGDVNDVNDDRHDDVKNDMNDVNDDRHDDMKNDVNDVNDDRHDDMKNDVNNVNDDRHDHHDDMKDDMNDVNDPNHLTFTSPTSPDVGDSPLSQHLFLHRRHTLRRLFNDGYYLNPSVPVYLITIHPSTVCYQDTDSNYYLNRYISNHFTGIYTSNPHCSPDIINDTMHAMLAHNKLMANFARHSIARRPYGLGFEGAFIICRYLNRKKKYYGIKWGDDSELRLGTRLDPSAYDSNGVLITDYTPFWKPKKTVLPQPNGEYIHLDPHQLLVNQVNYLDYIHDQNVKCIGVDLARRDQYKFVNYFHMVVLQKDLRLMRYEGNNKWITFPINEPIESVIDNIIDTFQRTIQSYHDIVSFRSSDKPPMPFRLSDFARTAAYRFNKRNAASTIVRRLEHEGKTQYIPAIGERLSFVTIIDDRTRTERLNGRAGDGRVAERSLVLDEIIAMKMEEMSRERFNEKVSEMVNFTVDYDDYIEAMCITELDHKYYLECLAKSMALYIVGDRFPETIRAIDEGVINAKDAGAKISAHQAAIAKEYVGRYFHSDRDAKRAARELSKEVTLPKRAMTTGLMEAYRDVFPSSSAEPNGINWIAEQQKLDAEMGREKELIRKMREAIALIRMNEFVVDEKAKKVARDMNIDVNMPLGDVMDAMKAVLKEKTERVAKGEHLRTLIDRHVNGDVTIADSDVELNMTVEEADESKRMSRRKREEKVEMMRMERDGVKVNGSSRLTNAPPRRGKGSFDMKKFEREPTSFSRRRKKLMDGDVDVHTVTDTADVHTVTDTVTDTADVHTVTDTVMDTTSTRAATTPSTTHRSRLSAPPSRRNRSNK